MFIFLLGALLGWRSAGDQKKTQTIRLVDVFIVGPLILVAASQITGALRTALIVTGAATISFNGRNYLTGRAK